MRPASRRIFGSTFDEIDAHLAERRRFPEAVVEAATAEFVAHASDLDIDVTESRLLGVATGTTPPPPARAPCADAAPPSWREETLPDLQYLVLAVEEARRALRACEKIDCRREGVTGRVWQGATTTTSGSVSGIRD